ncbi:hypothetical protein [Candidatus Hamiltonella defensa]|uniref:hypothetical protein n=1 Tax=Candidatus Williamhamiltonella defendens TaxID=138072 RepID=UPI0015826FCD|nr:hypothetical protein [Candidatus Hamiltonella defensa]
MPNHSFSSPHSDFSTHFVPEYSFDFSQHHHIFIKAKNRINNINHLSTYYNKDGLCFALSVRYIIEEHHSAGGGKGYMLWLKSLTESDDKNYLKIKGNEDAYQIEKILKNQLRHQYLSTELEKMFRLDSSQNTEIAGENLLFYKKSHSQQIKSIVSSLFTSANEEYSETIERNSLKVDTKNNSGYIMPFQSSSETRLMSFFDLLKNPSQNQYFLFYTENHAMAVTVIHQNGQRYWTFFDANLGAYSFNQYTAWREFTTNCLLNTTRSNGEKLYQFQDPEAGEKTKIQYTRLVPNDNSSYDGVWKEAQSQEESYFLKSLVEKKIQVNFHPKVKGQLVSYTLNADNKMTQITIKIVHHKNNELLVTLPYDSFNQIRESVLRRIDKKGHLIINEYSKNPLDNLEPAQHRIGRVKQVIKIINDVASKKLDYEFIEKDKGMLTLLKGFFEDKNHVFNYKEFIKICFDPLKRKNWMLKAKQLLIMGNIDNELNTLSDQEALEKAYYLRVIQEKNLKDLIVLSSKKQYKSAGIRTNIYPQSLYIPNIENQAYNSLTLGIIWVNLKTKGKESYNNFLKFLTTHFMINIDQADSPISHSDHKKLKEFQNLFQSLKEDIKQKQKNIFITTSHHSVLPKKPKRYFLSSTQSNHGHILVLDITQNDQGNTMTLYDPIIGDIKIKTSDEKNTEFDQFLNDYLDSKVLDHQTRGQLYGFEKFRGHYYFKITTLEQDALTDFNQLNNIDTFISDFRSDKERIFELPNIILNKLTFSPSLIYKMGGMFGEQGLSVENFSSPEKLLSRLRFNARKLKDYLLNQNTQAHEVEIAITLLKEKIKITPSISAILEGEKEDKKMTTNLIQSIPDKPVSSSHLKKNFLNIYKKMNRIDTFMQISNYFHGIYEIIKIKNLLKNKSLTNQERKIIEIQQKALYSSLFFSANLDLSQYGFYKLHMNLTGIPKHQLQLYSPSIQIGLNKGIQFLPFINMGLGLSISFYDFYQAYFNFQKISDTADPKVRQDLMVNASLSLFSGGLGVGTSASAIIGYKSALLGGATAAKLVMMSGMTGVIGGIAILATSQLYSAFRRLEEIQNHVELNTEEFWKNYARLFVGLGPTIALQNKELKQKSEHAARQQFNQILKDNAQKTLKHLSPQKINVYFYSQQDFKIEMKPYKLLSYKKWVNPMFGRTFSLVDIEKDKLEPKEAEKFIADHAQQFKQIEMKDSEYRYPEPSHLKAVNDHINVNEDDDNNVTVKKISSDDSDIAQEESMALFDLGEGDDIAVGYLQKRNIFKISAGSKQYTGGDKADIFYLSKPDLLAQASYFNGLGGDDIIIAESVLPGKTGYFIDLMQGKIHYGSIENKKLGANINNIEHAYGNASTDDEIKGNDANNYLNGRGGNDHIWGYSGNDVLTFEQGHIHGGEGNDHYILLQNSTDNNVVAHIYDTKDDFSLVSLHHQVNDITSVILEQENQIYSLKITLRNQNQTETTFVIHDIYSFEDGDIEKKYLVLNNEYLFSTLDGFLLLPNWPKIIEKNAEGIFPFSPQFNARYNIFNDIEHHSDIPSFSKEKTQVSFQKNTQQDYLVVGDKKVILPETVKLMMIDTPLNDQLIGNAEHNLFVSRRGDDELEGGPGKDIYHIELPYEHERIISINNYDHTAEPEDDLLILPVAIEQINILTQLEDDLILGPTSSDQTSPLKIRFKGFMKSQSYRHINIMDSRQQFYHLKVDEAGKIYLGQDETRLVATEKDDLLVLTGADVFIEKKFDAGAGDDVIIDHSHHHNTLHGGQGNDRIIATGTGNKVLYGDSGNDKIFVYEGNNFIVGGIGNDFLSGGLGDDIYLISYKDGHTVIEDNGGNDTLVLYDILTDEVYTIEEGEDRILKTSKPGFEQAFSVTLKKGAKLNTAQKIEKIQTRSDLKLKQTTSADQQKELTQQASERIQTPNDKNMTTDLMTMLMSGFNESESIPLTQGVAQSRNQLISETLASR